MTEIIASPRRGTAMKNIKTVLLLLFLLRSFPLSVGCGGSCFVSAFAPTYWSSSSPSSLIALRQRRPSVSKRFAKTDKKGEIDVAGLMGFGDSSSKKEETANIDDRSKHAFTLHEFLEQPDLEPESRHRRRILLSMLAYAAGSGMVPLAPSDAATETGTEEFQLPTKDIMKPPLDDREYEFIILENGLRVLLCSDPTSNEAAAAMDVHVGACSDPNSIPGLAHFHEHMLFLGTKEYPKEDSFEAFLSANGGGSNAFTDAENTVYYFSMEAEAENRLMEGLNRFGSFFTAPLFTESATGRELNAIESENAKNLQSDVFRYFQITKSRSSNQHPFSKFFTGNKKTLLEDAKKQGLDLRKALVDFNKRYYSANQMTLAVVAPQSIEKLKKSVASAFGRIPNRNVPRPELEWRGTPVFDNGNSIIPSFRHIVEIVPVQDLRQIMLSWPIGYDSDEERQKMLLNKQFEYVAHLIGHEGPGSLQSYLKRQNWANSLAAADNPELSDLETLDITIELTTQGLNHVNQVAEAVFSYISMLRQVSIPEYVLPEVLQLNELEWRFLTKGETANYATSLSTAMQKFDAPKLYVAGPRRMALSKYERLTSKPRTIFETVEEEMETRRLVEQLISKLTVDNVIVTVLSKSFVGQTNQKERWYGTDYRVRPIEEAVLNRWRNPTPAKDLGIHYPKPNVFIPSEAGLRIKFQPIKNGNVTRSLEDRLKPISPPRIIRDDELEGRWTVFYKPDDRFGQPKAFVVFQLLTKEAYSSPERAALAQLYQQCATDHLDEYAYDAQLAGLTFDVQVLPRGLRLTFGGYNDKLLEFAAYVTQSLAKNPKKILPRNDLEFERYKDNLMRGLSAFDVKQPYAHASYYAYLTMQPRNFQYTNGELRDAVRKSTLPALEAYTRKLWASGRGEALVQGNLYENDAIALVNTIDKILAFKTIQATDYPPRLMALPLPREVPTRLTISEPNLANRNSAVHVLLQSLGRSERDHVLIEILSAIVEEPFYGDLRTKQQLGYIVSSGIRALEETRTIAFVVQSSVQPVDKLSYEILTFLDKFENQLVELSKGDFAVYVKGLIDRKLEPDKQLAVEVMRNWAEISSGRLQFDRAQREVAALLDVTKQDLIDFWKTIYAANLRRILITEIVPHEGDASAPEPPESMGYATGRADDSYILQLGIDDIQPFRKNRELT